MNNRGQFTIIAALLVAVVLIATVIVTYSSIRNTAVRDQPPIQSAIDETNFAIKQILGFTVGYYGSVLQVTGNSTYAKELARNYLQSGLVNIASMHPEWGTSFNVSSSDLYTYWFTNASYSTGELGIMYNLTGLGISGIAYETSCKLGVQIMNTTGSQAFLSATKDDDEPLINLGKQNFKFYRYQNSTSTWELTNQNITLIAYANGTYQIDLPPEIDPNSYIVQIEDPRGIIVVASSYSRYTCELTWTHDFSTIPNETIMVELLQNGTMRWLGQNLQLTTQAKPLPPISVKSIHVNQTINGVNSEVPFQIEDWASEYRIPLGLTNNASVFSSRNMLVFLVTPRTSKVTIWWNGSDTTVQTPYAYQNKYFTGDDPTNAKLTNGILTLRFQSGFQVNSTVNGSSTVATFMRINTENSTYGSGLSYTITNGVVRDVIHQEAEWNTDLGGGGAKDCPNLYAHIVLTLPANTTYYTYQSRLMFVQSQQKRNITDLSLILLKSLTGTMQTENGTLSGFPAVVNGTGVFHNYSASTWAHHWCQSISGTKGAGLMFTDSSNYDLYTFDTIAGNKTGAIRADSTAKIIQLLPVTLTPANFTYALDKIWYGAIVTFDGTTPIYKEDGSIKTGLWMFVEYPPTVTVSTET